MPEVEEVSAGGYMYLCQVAANWVVWAEKRCRVIRVPFGSDARCAQALVRPRGSM